MKTSDNLNSSKIPDVQIDPSLEQYRDKILFPKKLEDANKVLKTAKLPDRKNPADFLVPPLK